MTNARFLLSRYSAVSCDNATPGAQIFLRACTDPACDVRHHGLRLLAARMARKRRRFSCCASRRIRVTEIRPRGMAAGTVQASSERRNCPPSAQQCPRRATILEDGFLTRLCGQRRLQLDSEPVIHS